MSVWQKKSLKLFAATIVGTYTAITGSEYQTQVVFSENGSGVITETKIDKNRTKVNKTNFTYTVKGNDVTMNVVNDKYDEPIIYKVSFVDGFALVEETDGNDTELVLYKNGRDLGKPNMSKIVGTWSYSHKTEYWSEEFTVVINQDGTGKMTDIYKDGSYEETNEASLLCKMRNAYIIDVTATAVGPEGVEVENGLAAILGGKLYLFDEDGEVDNDDILTKK